MTPWWPSVPVVRAFWPGLAVRSLDPDPHRPEDFAELRRVESPDFLDGEEPFLGGSADAAFFPPEPDTEL